MLRQVDHIISTVDDRARKDGESCVAKLVTMPTWMANSDNPRKRKRRKNHENFHESFSMTWKHDTFPCFVRWAQEHDTLINLGVCEWVLVFLWVRWVKQALGLNLRSKRNMCGPLLGHIGPMVATTVEMSCPTLPGWVWLDSKFWCWIVFFKHSDQVTGAKKTFGHAWKCSAW